MEYTAISDGRVLFAKWEARKEKEGVMPRTVADLELELTNVALLVGEEAEFLAETDPENELVRLYQNIDEPGGEKKFWERYCHPGAVKKGKITLSEEVHCWRAFLRALRAANAEYVRP